MTTTYGEGDDFPEFEMETPDGGTVTKADLSGKKAVIFFYPKDNTPGCTTEAKDFSALKSAFDKADVSLLGVSKDSAKKHQNFIAKHDLTVDLATDAAGGGLSQDNSDGSATPQSANSRTRDVRSASRISGGRRAASDVCSRSVQSR